MPDARSMDKETTIFRKLCEVARDQGIVSYSELGALVGLNMGDPRHRDCLSEILGEINIKEHEAGRPLISAVAVLKGGTRPGVGFWNIAQDPIGRYGGSPDQGARDDFWVREMRRVHDLWRTARGVPAGAGSPIP